MSSAPETVLCYGFQIEPRHGEDETTFEHFLAEIAGSKKPDREIDRERWKSDRAYREAWEAYWEEKLSATEESGVTVVRYGSPQEPRYLLAAKASTLKVRDEEPAVIKEALTILSVCREDIRSFCEKTGIEFQEPQLIVCSFEG